MTGTPGNALGPIDWRIVRGKLAEAENAAERGDEWARRYVDDLRAFVVEYERLERERDRFAAGP